MTGKQEAGIVIAIMAAFAGVMVKAIPAKAVFDPWVYDTDGDCYISGAEAMDAVNAWLFDSLTEAEAMQVKDLWLDSTRNPACPPE